MKKSKSKSHPADVHELPRADIVGVDEECLVVSVEELAELGSVLLLEGFLSRREEKEGGDLNRSIEEAQPPPGRLFVEGSSLRLWPRAGPRRALQAREVDRERSPASFSIAIGEDAAREAHGIEQGRNQRRRLDAVHALALMISL